MDFLKLIKRAVGFARPNNCVPVNFKEMILIIEPREVAVLVIRPGAEMIVTGFAGTIWITVDGDPARYVVKHGETFKIPAHGKVTIRSVAEHVPGRLHVKHVTEQCLIH